ncbi:MAG: isocitrate/isopropylmalate family dehydrogenase, partial [Lentisphaeria bacterium]
EPVHGSAPDIAGKGIANPMALLWSVVMMLEFLEETGASRGLMTALEAVTGEGKVLTADLGGQANTKQFTDAVLNRLNNPGI